MHIIKFLTLFTLTVFTDVIFTCLTLPIAEVSLTHLSCTSLPLSLSSLSCANSLGWCPCWPFYGSAWTRSSRFWIAWRCGAYFCLHKEKHIFYLFVYLVEHYLTFYPDMRKQERVVRQSINLALSVRGRAALAAVGLEEQVRKKKYR